MDVLPEVNLTHFEILSNIRRDPVTIISIAVRMSLEIGRICTRKVDLVQESK